MLDHESEASLQLIVHDILDNETNAMIVEPDGQVEYSFHKGVNEERIEKKILRESTFFSGAETQLPVLKEMILPSTTEEGTMEQFIVIADPFDRWRNGRFGHHLPKLRSYSSYD